MTAISAGREISCKREFVQITENSAPEVRDSKASSGYIRDKEWANILFESSPDSRFVPWQLADDPTTYGEKAGWWIVVSPDFEEEHSEPVPTLNECLAIIAQLETARCEQHADPYPDREYPEADFN